jgi:hypothetical protein
MAISYKISESDYLSTKFAAYTISTNIRLGESESWRAFIEDRFRSLIGQMFEIDGAEFNLDHFHPEIADLVLAQISSDLTRSAIFRYQDRFKRMLARARRPGRTLLDIEKCLNGAVRYTYEEFRRRGWIGHASLGSGRKITETLVHAGVLRWKDVERTVNKGTSAGPVLGEVLHRPETDEFSWEKFFDEVEAMKVPTHTGSATH